MERKEDTVEGMNTQGMSAIAAMVEWGREEREG